MKHRNNTMFVIVALVGIITSSCAKKDLDRETAMKLLKERVNVTVQASFETSPGYPLYGEFENALSGFRALAQEGVIICDIPGTIYCALGPKAEGLTIEGSHFKFLAGQIIPGEITGVAQEGPDLATAQFSTQFTYSPFYSQYKLLAFDKLVHAGPVNWTIYTNPPGFQRYINTSGQATFKRYDDGWRVEAIN